MVGEELVDSRLGVLFDLPVVGIVDRCQEHVEIAEAILVVGEPMTDERPGGQPCALFHGQRAGPSHTAATYDGGVTGDALGDLRCQGGVLGSEVEPRAYGSCQLNPVTRPRPVHAPRC